MKKSLILLGLLSIGYTYAQVGVNISTPNATMDIKARKSDGTTKEGLLIPRLSKEAIAKMVSPEKSTLVYVNNISYSGSEGQISDVDAEGFYYYNGSKWAKMTSTSVANNTLWEKDSNNNTILAGRITTGTTRNDVSVNSQGVITAKGFVGYGGSTMFPDYVFQKYYTGHSTIKEDYEFKTLSQVEDFIKANGHLPNYPSAEEIKNQGFIDVMKTQLTNVEKIEELYLHLIEKEKEIQELKQRLEKLEKLVK